MSTPESPVSSLAVAAASGSRLTALQVLRDSLALDLDVCASLRDKASLSQRFMDVLAQIEDVQKAAPEKGGTALDELEQRRRAAGRPNAAGKAGASRP